MSTDNKPFSFFSYLRVSMEVGSVVNTNHHEGQILSGGNYNEIKILAHFSCTCIPEE